MMQIPVAVRTPVIAPLIKQLRKIDSKLSDDERVALYAEKLEGF